MLNLSPPSFFLKNVIFHSKISILGLRQTFLDLYQSNQDCGGSIPVLYQMMSPDNPNGKNCEYAQKPKTRASK